MRRGIRRTAACLAACILLCAALTGCSPKRYTYEPEVTSVFLDPSGTVEECLMDTLGEPYMTPNGLENFIREQISAYQEGETAEKVKLQSVEATDAGVMVRLSYASAQDYDDFNYGDGLFSSLRIAPMTDVVQKGTRAGITLPSTLITAGKGEQANLEKLQKRAKNYTVAAGTAGSTDAVIYVEGKVQYVTPNVIAADQNMVKVPAGEEFVLVYR